VNRKDTEEFQRQLMAMRNQDEGHIIIGFGAHAPNADTRKGSVSVAVMKGEFSATCEAVYLPDAFALARADIRAQEAAKVEAVAVEKDAEAIYNSWSDQPGFVAWLKGGNSDMQEEARKQARKARSKAVQA